MQLPVDWATLTVTAALKKRWAVHLCLSMERGYNVLINTVKTVVDLSHHLVH